MPKHPEKSLRAAGTGNVGENAAPSAEAARKEIARLGRSIEEKRTRPAAKAESRVRKVKSGTKDTGQTRNAVLDGHLIPLKTVCGKLEIDPKRARVILRKAVRKGGSGVRHEIGEQRWMLTPKQAETVKGILREHLRANA